MLRAKTLLLVPVLALAVTACGGGAVEGSQSQGGGIAPAVSLAATPLSVTSGGSSTLTWSSTNATSCTASGAWSGAKATSGSQSTGPLTASSSFTLTCTGTTGAQTNASKSAMVFVLGTQSFAQLAASLQPGQWAALATANINAALLDPGGASGYITGYAESLKWDPLTRQLFFLGMDHHPDTGQRFVSYSDSTNTWQILPQTSWMATGGVHHGYDHQALDVANRYLYVRGHYMDRSVYRYQIDTKTWERVQDNNVLEYSQCCGGWDYFPELNGVVWFQGSDTQSGSTFYGGLFLRDDLTGSWRRLGQSAAYLAGTYHNFAEYNPKQKVVIFGGGDGATRTLYKLDSSGTITSLKPAPVDLGITKSIVTTDPVTGKYLVLSNTGSSFYSYEVASDTWTLLPAAPILSSVQSSSGPTFGTVATPVSTYGVTLFVQCNPGNCAVYLYKHSGS